MNNPEKVKRQFSKSSLLLLEQARVMLTCFAEDQAAFAARYPYMNAGYVAAWQTAITNANNMPTDKAMVSEQKEKTYAMKDKMALAAIKYNTLISFLKIIYKENPKRALEHFGYKTSRRSIARQMRNNDLLLIAYERANSAPYNADLIARGFTQVDIDELNTLAQQLEASNLEQEKSKTERVNSAQQRIMLHNIVWDIMTEVNLASMIVFANHYAKQKKYQLYSEGKSKSKKLKTLQYPAAQNFSENESASSAINGKLRITSISGQPA